MNDRSLASLLAELDEELARETDPHPSAAEILDMVEGRAPGAVLRTAAIIQLRSLGVAIATR